MTDWKDATVKWLQEQRDYMKERLADYESGRWKTGRIEDGQMIDETPGAMEFLRAKIAELGQLIGAYKKSE